MSVTTYSLVNNKMKIDSLGDYVSLESYLILDELNLALKERVKSLENLVVFYRTTMEKKRIGGHISDRSNSLCKY